MVPTSNEIAEASTEVENWLDDLDPDDENVLVERELADLRAIGTAIYAVEVAETGLVRAVAEAKHGGRSWTEIANVLGVSRQAARQRFSGKLDLAWPTVEVQVSARGEASSTAKKPA